jgi:hypothetical protein
MWVAFKDETLKQRSVKIVPIAFLDCQGIIVDFRAELPEQNPAQLC